MRGLRTAAQVSKSYRRAVFVQVSGMLEWKPHKETGSLRHRVRIRVDRCCVKFISFPVH